MNAGTFDVAAAGHHRHARLGHDPEHGDEHGDDAPRHYALGRHRSSSVDDSCACVSTGAYFRRRGPSPRALLHTPKTSTRSASLTFWKLRNVRAAR